MNEKKPSDKKPVLEEVTLIKPHTHCGKPCVVGEKISVTAKQKRFLEAHDVIKKSGV